MTLTDLWPGIVIGYLTKHGVDFRDFPEGRYPFGVGYAFGSFKYLIIKTDYAKVAVK